MRFYYCNCNGDEGVFSEKDLIKAIYSAWNIEADLYVIPPKTIMRDIYRISDDKCMRMDWSELYMSLS